jgi:hypothetical protein
VIETNSLIDSEVAASKRKASTSDLSMVLGAMIRRCEAISSPVKVPCSASQTRQNGVPLFFGLQLINGYVRDKV